MRKAKGGCSFCAHKQRLAVMETPMGNFIVALSTSRVVLNVSHFCHSCMHEGLLHYYISTKSLQQGLEIHSLREWGPRRYTGFFFWIQITLEITDFSPKPCRYMFFMPKKYYSCCSISKCTPFFRFLFWILFWIPFWIPFWNHFWVLLLITFWVPLWIWF